VAVALDRHTLELLDRSDEIDILTPRREGSTSSRPIWVVVVDGDAYVRSWRGTHGAWYRRALAERRAAVRAGGRAIDVELEPVPDEELNERVSDAFWEKYGARYRGPTEEMVTPEVSRTTMRLTPDASPG
jgi:hypothetical protein